MYNACIIGAGSIGALKPNTKDSPYSKDVLTHAHALYIFRKKKIIKDFYLIDIDRKKLKEACEKWKCRGFNSIESLNKNIDIFIVSVDTEYHYDILNYIFKNFTPKIVIVEKPFCSSYEQAKNIYKKYQQKNISIVVNYIRRFCPTIQNLKEDIINNKYGEVKACNIIYVRGFIRDASHAIDLCNYFFGEFKHGGILGSKYNAYADHSENDLTVPVWMEYENCRNVYLTPADGRDYSIFEFDILTKNARINIIDHSRKTKIFLKEPEKIYGDFNSITYQANEIINNDLENAMYFMHGNVIGYLQSDKKQYDLFCTGLDGLKVQKVYNKLGK